MEHKDIHTWCVYLGYFTLVALIDCEVVSRLNYYIGILAIYYRTKLTRKAWALSNHKKFEGGPQRVQQDCYDYPNLLLNLLNGVIRSVIMIGVFSAILWHQVSWIYVLVPYLYAFAGTGGAYMVAFPLISLNYLNQVYEAHFRQTLTKKVYARVHNNNINLFTTTKNLNRFQNFYNQITVIVPHIILFSVYYTSKISFGIFMQVASCMAEIINNLSYLINSFTDINKWLSCRKRLKEMGII